MRFRSSFRRSRLNRLEKSRQAAAGPPAAAPSVERPAPASTPLIDAHIQRVADITRQHREAIASSPTPDEPEEPTRPRVPSLMFSAGSLVAESTTPDHSLRTDEIVPLPQRLSRNVEDDRSAAKQPARSDARTTLSVGPPAPSRTPSAEVAKKLEGAKPPIAPKAAEASSKAAATPVPRTKEHRVTVATDDRASNSASDDEPDSAVVDREANPVQVGPLSISELRLCRSITGFGSFEPLADERVKAGQRLLIYCELTGLRYEERDVGFVSRISSRVELKSVQGGPVIWEQELGDAEDACRRRRRDYYVNYFVDLPKSLRPGSYRLRLLQTDLVAGCSTSTDIPLEITP